MNLKTILGNIRKITKYRVIQIPYHYVQMLIDTVKQCPLLGDANSLLMLVLREAADKSALKAAAEKSRLDSHDLECLTQAPYVVLIFGDANREHWRENGWIAVSTMTIAANQTGLRTLPLIIPKALELNRIFEVPAGKRLIAAIPLGLAAEARTHPRIGFEIVERFSREIASESSPEQEEELIKYAPILDAIHRCPMFGVLSELSLLKMAALFSVKSCEQGQEIIRKGVPPVGFFVIASGICEVVGGDEKGHEKILSTLREGDCFGEMSILCREPISATIRASSQADLLYMEVEDFLTVLEENPGLNLHFTKLIAVRLKNANLRLVQETVVHGITGQLSTISLPDIVQALEVSGKNGRLILDPPQGVGATMGFNQGHLESVEFEDLTGNEAFFKLLTWTTGQFRFVEGELPGERNTTMDIMGLLMEGCRRIDETRRMEKESLDFEPEPF